MENKTFSNHTESFWHKTGDVDRYPKLDKDITVDLAVIGGGIAGILAAYEMAKRGKSVALLEARKMLHGTTGFTTAKLSAQHDTIYNELIRRYGEEKARSYYEANIEGIKIIREIAEKYEIECDLEEQDSYMYTLERSKVSYMEKESEAYKSLYIDGGLVENIPVGLDIEVGVVMRKQYEFHPVKFLSGVLKELEKMNVLIFENTMITEVNDGDEVSLKTKDGNFINCKQAICASHYPLDDPDKFYAKNMKLIMLFVTMYEYDDKYPGGMYISVGKPSRTFRSVDTNGKQYILVGGEGHTPGTGTSELERYKTIEDFAKKSFGVKEVISRWSAHDYLTKDNMPFVGLSGPDRKNIFVITGLNEWGLSNAAISSKILADSIEGRENPYKELFNPYRDIPDLEESEQEESKDERRSSTPKDDVDDLGKGEALTYEEGDKKFGVFRDNSDKLHKLDLTCTHLGCKVAWNDGDQTWDCPCHGSRFSSRGDVIEGPALKPLKKINGDKIIDEKL